jgi:hypothetical protein
MAMRRRWAHSYLVVHQSMACALKALTLPERIMIELETLMPPTVHELRQLLSVV